MTINFVTGNKSKFQIAQQFLENSNLDLVQKVLDIPEIQAKTSEEVVIDKAKKAFEILKEPLFVSDHQWSITALNGFPGPYMKDMNEWLSSEDWLNLMSAHKNREVYLTEIICYIDKNTLKIFTHKQKAYVLYEKKGDRLTSENIFSFEGENGRSIAEVNTQDNKAASDPTKLWEEFSNWLNNT